MQQVDAASNRPRPAPRAPGSRRYAPHPAPRSRPPTRHPARNTLPLRRLALAALAGIAAFAALGGGLSRHAPPLTETLDRLALAAGFAVAQIEIRGHVHTSDSAIHDTLDIANAGSMLRLDSAAMRQRIERLPWIASASVTRVFPDRLQIVVTERKPHARWQRGERMHLIDDSGRVLAAIPAGTATHLPLVTGEGAAEAAQGLLTLLERYPEILGRLEAADRVEARRWTLRLEDGPALQLPAAAEAAALARIAAAGLLQGAAATAGSHIDARAGDRIVLRPASQPPAATTPAGREPAAARSGAAREKPGAQRG